MQGQYLASTTLLIKLTFLFLIKVSNRLFDVLPQDLAQTPQRSTFIIFFHLTFYAAPSLLVKEQKTC